MFTQMWACHLTHRCRQRLDNLRSLSSEHVPLPGATQALSRHAPIASSRKRFRKGLVELPFYLWCTQSQTLSGGWSCVSRSQVAATGPDPCFPWLLDPKYISCVRQTAKRWTYFFLKYCTLVRIKFFCIISTF